MEKVLKLFGVLRVSKDSYITIIGQGKYWRIAYLKGLVKKYVVNPKT